jgi:3-deoxy-D-manno-octulosonate 8-phosphate phosphatase (KDO 8-P phosphatase)
MTTPASAKHVRLLALDIDGVLTDASIFIGPDGRETKRFNARDGIALRAWTRLGLPAAVITGRAGPAIAHRLADLGVTHVMQGSKDKLRDLAELERVSGVPASAMAYMGDDWPDLPVLRRVGLPMAPANADARVKAAAHLVTQAQGGHGAVREAVEALLGAMGRLEEAVALYDRA